MALAARGRDVVVIDRQFGCGAAARSGGLIVPDTLVGPAVGFDACEAALAEWVSECAPECGLRWDGCWELDRDATLDPTPIDWHDTGPVRLSRTVGGGTLDPAALIAALARTARANGAVPVEAAALGCCPGIDDDVRLETTAGSIVARRVLFATDATAVVDEKDIWSERHLTVALETARLTSEVADRIGWTSRMPFYTNDLPLLWGRAAPDGGLIAGRELVRLCGQSDARLRTELDQAEARLVNRVRGIHPALADIGVRRIWAGPIGRDSSGVPRIVTDVRTSGVYWAGGYGGHGLAQAFRLGRRAADCLADCR